MRTSPDSLGSTLKPGINAGIEIRAEDDREDLLKGKDSVVYGTAADYLGVTDRQIRKLAKTGKLESRGLGLQKRITTASLRRYKGVKPLTEESSPEKRNRTEQNGTPRN